MHIEGAAHEGFEDSSRLFAPRDYGILGGLKMDGNTWKEVKLDLDCPLH